MSSKKGSILTINSGSSSIKFSIYDLDTTETLVISGELSRIGLDNGNFTVKNTNGSIIHNDNSIYKTHEIAFNELFNWLTKSNFDNNIKAVGHRILNGGTQFRIPQIITTSLIKELMTLRRLDQEHLPHEIKGINFAKQNYPNITQVACFDTAFHRNIPKVAKQYPIPRNFYDEGVIRYGFHGLSYEFVNDTLNTLESQNSKKEKVIIAHLGNGASMAAIKDGQCIDTTMGFTPTGGLVMSTRSGDLDPGVIYYLLDEKKMSPSAVYNMLNKKSGLLAVSNLSSDMKDLLQAQKENPYADEAISLFCYQAKKFLGALVAVLGGLDTLIFTGGIGENSAAIRFNICENLDSFGIKLDSILNSQNAPLLSSNTSKVSVRIIPTNEELMIARHTSQIIKELP